MQLLESSNVVGVAREGAARASVEDGQGPCGATATAQTRTSDGLLVVGVLDLSQHKNLNCYKLTHRSCVVIVVLRCCFGLFPPHALFARRPYGEHPSGRDRKSHIKRCLHARAIPLRAVLTVSFVVPFYAGFKHMGHVSVQGRDSSACMAAITMERWQHSYTHSRLCLPPPDIAKAPSSQ